MEYMKLDWKVSRCGFFLVVFLFLFPLVAVAKNQHRLRVLVPVISSGNVNAFGDTAISGNLEEANKQIYG